MFFLVRAAGARGVRGAAAAALLAAAASPAAAQGDVHRSQQGPIRTVTVAEGLENAWGMAFLPGGDILVTEKPGRLRIIRQGKLEPQPIEGVPAVFHRGQGGLLDVALHPQFASNRLVYLSYSKPLGGDQSTTAVVRGRLEGNRLVGVEEVFEAKARSERTLHFGSRLAFGRDGNLFVTVGDRGDRTDAGERQNAQQLTTHAGKVLRITPEGKVPQDNPFVGHATALPEIYSYGNRNPQGLTIHPVTGEVWEVEHGPRGGDEINLIRPGRNYGWPVISYGINYSGTSFTDLTAKEGMEQPLHYWVPSIATSGMTIYSGDKFPEWEGDVFVGGLAGMQLARVEFEGTRPVREETLLKNVVGRIRDVRTGPDGYLYILTDSPEGELLRVEPAGE